MIKVRFNLGRGKNYKKWKIQGKDFVEYYAPEDVQLILNKCTLKNNKKMATKIFNGENKDVCAWIRCEEVIIKHRDKDEYFYSNKQVEKLLYDPKVAPYWRISEYDCLNVDDFVFEQIFTDYKNLFVEIP
jgi:hypothetical protein